MFSNVLWHKTSTWFKPLVVVMLFGVNVSLAQTPTNKWAVSSTTGIANGMGKCIVVDSENNAITFGEFRHLADFDFGPGNYFLNSDENAPFLVKTDSAANTLWAKQFISSSWTKAEGLQVDSQNNICVVGYFSDTVDFDPGPNSLLISPTGPSDGYLVKLDSNGDLIWAHTIGGLNPSFIYDVDFDDSNNIYIAGRYQGAVDFDPGPGTAIETATGIITDGCIAKYSPSGEFIWARSFHSDDYSTINALTVFDDAIVVSGAFTGTVDTDPGSGVSDLVTNLQPDGFIVKLDTSGNFIWSAQLAGPGTSGCSDIITDHFGNIYGCGSFSNSVDLDPGANVSNYTSNGSNYAFLIKLDASGNYVFGNTIGGVDGDAIVSIAVDSSLNIYGTGHIWESVDVDPGPNTDWLTSNGGWDIFTFKRNPDGSHNWAINLGSSDSDLGNSIALDAHDNLLVTGQFNDTVDFNPNNGVHILEHTYGFDFFIQKLTFCTPDTLVDQVHSCGPYNWIDGNTYTSSNNTAFHVLSNASGCDSTIFLDLTVSSQDSVTDVVHACSAYTWIDGVTYTVSNTTATHTLSNTNGCDSTVLLDLTITEIDTSVDNLNDTLSSNAINASFQWIECITQTIIPGATNATFAPTAEGSYGVIITSGNCMDTSECVAVTFSSLDKMQRLNAFVFPNPATHTISVLIFESGEGKLVLHDVSGTQIQSEKIDPDNPRLDLEIQSLSPGIYLLHLELDSGKSATFRFVKE